jgi:hypothetical protein
MKASEYFQGAVGGIFDLVFGIGGDGRRHSSAEAYDVDEPATPDIYINGNIHSDQGAAQSQAAPASLDQLPTIANVVALQEGYAQPHDNPVYEMRAPQYPPAPSSNDVSAAAFHQAMQEQDHGIRM